MRRQPRVPLGSVTAAPGVLMLQRALVWLAGASGAIVFIEPSPYELVTIVATVILFATGLRVRLVFMPLLLLLLLVNIGYSFCAVPFMDKLEIVNWIATSWYMAFTVMFFAIADLRRHRGPSRHASPRPGRGGPDRQRWPPSPAISTSSPAGMIC